MSKVRVTVFARTDAGRVRTTNEDAFLVSDLESGKDLSVPAVDVAVRDRGVLAVVSDGMGGHAAGDVASKLVVESLRRSLTAHDGGASSLRAFIDGAVQRANVDVQEAARARDHSGMGATLTGVILHDRAAYIAEVGDSRGYLLRAGRLRQITKDQSFVQLLIDAGVPPERAKKSPRKNVIMQALGREEDVQVSIGRLNLRSGDRLLLCSDGLTNTIPDAEIAQLLAAEDANRICDHMIDLANERGAEDNVTAVVILVSGEGLPSPRVAESVTLTLETLQEFRGRSEPPPKLPSAKPVATRTPSVRPGPNGSARLAPGRGSTRPADRAVTTGRSNGAVWLVPVLVAGVLVFAALLAWRFFG